MRISGTLLSYIYATFQFTEWHMSTTIYHPNLCIVKMGSEKGNNSTGGKIAENMSTLRLSASFQFSIT